MYKKVLRVQVLLRGAKELGSLTCAAHYAQLTAGLCFPGTAAQELSSDLFSLRLDQFPIDATESVILNDPWPLLIYPTGGAKV